MRRFGALAALVLVAALAGCGGTDWNAAGGPGASPAARRVTPAKSNTPATASAAERPYVDAMVTSALASSDGSDGVTPENARCFATAMVHGYGTRAFDAAGLSPNALRDPNSSLDGLADPTAAQIDTIGAALQHCGFGPLLATAILARLDAAPGAAKCLGDRIDHDPQARRVILLGGLGRDLDQAGAHAVVALMAGCLDLAALVVDDSGVTLDPGTRACMVTALRGQLAALEDYMVLRVSGTDPELEAEAQGTVSVALNRCRPSAHTGFTVPSG